MCGPALEDLSTLLRASLISRGVSRQSVNVAMGAAAVGTLISSSSRGRVNRKVMFVVNVATLVSMVNALRHSSPLRPEGTRATAVTPMDLAFASLPPTFIGVGSADPLAESSRLCADHLRKQKINIDQLPAKNGPGSPDKPDTTPLFWGD